MDLTKLHKLSSELGDILESKKLYFTSAESCTGGWVGKAITSVRGSSGWFGCGFITYSNSSKQRILNVSNQTLKNFGAVSEEVVKEMVLGALDRSAADLGVAISGVAGPDGGTKERPVGTVCLAWALKENLITTSVEKFNGNREEVRYYSVERALLGSIDIVKNI